VRPLVAGPIGRPVNSAPRLLKATYLADGEGLLRETRGTSLYYFPKPILALLVFGVLDYSAYATEKGWANLPVLWRAFGWVNDNHSGWLPYLVDFFLVLTLLSALWFVVNYLRWVSTVYAVTTQRVIVQTGIFSRDLDQIPILQVRGVDVHQTFGQRMLGYGTMWVSSEEGRTKIGNEAWKGIPRPFEFQRLVESAGSNLAQRNAVGFR